MACRIAHTFWSGAKGFGVGEKDVIQKSNRMCFSFFGSDNLQIATASETAGGFG
jgi:hypothetical protein